MTTGVSPASVADAAGGVIAYVTRAGGTTLAGTLRAETDGSFASGSSVGYNRFEGAAGGSLPGVKRLTWFLSGSLQGQRSQYYGRGAAEQPTFVLAGVDTVVNWTSGTGQPMSLAIPAFAQASGQCGQLGSGTSVPSRAIQNNYGFDCVGVRRPIDWSSLVRLHGKLVYTYGDQSSLSITGLASGVQQRSFPGQHIADPSLYVGGHAWSRLAVANWTHGLGRAGTGPLTMDVNLSYGTDRLIAGPLDPSSELATRAPALGIELATLDFVAMNGIPFSLTDQLIRNIRTNSGLRVPYLGRPDLRNVQLYRLNPYGLVAGWPTQGLDARVTLAAESRWNGRWSLDWRPAAAHRVTLGGDFEKTEVSYYDADLLAETDLNAFLVHPWRYGVFGSDRLDLGRAVIDLGLRYDRFGSDAQFPDVPGRIFSNPAWDPLAATSDTAYAASVARVFTPARSRSTVSPRVRVGYTLSSRTSLRLAFGEQVERPSYAALFSRLNSDASFTSLFGPLFGRDVDYGKSVLVEVGARHAFTPELTVDLSAYNKDHLFHNFPGVFSYDDPASPGRTLAVFGVSERDVGTGTGLDVRLDWRRGELVSSAVAYSLLVTHGADVTTATTHAMYAMARLSAHDASALVTLRVTNGLPYVPLTNLGLGEVTAGQQLVFPAGLMTASLPWTKTLDLRLSKSIQMNGTAGTLFADFRNLLNFTNTLGVYAETGTAANDLYKAQLLSPEASTLATEASANGKLNPDGSIDLRSGCATWSGGNGGPVNCVMLQRAEARWGNGDGIYTTAEQDRALNAYFASFFGPWRFYGFGRTVRIGLEVGF